MKIPQKFMGMLGKFAESAGERAYKALPWALGGAAELAPEEAESAPAVKGFAEIYDKAVRDGSRKMMYAGTLDDAVYQQAARRDPSLRNNSVFVGPHGGQARIATGEMDPLEVGRHIENMLNSADTQALPNFPSSNYRNNAKNMLFLNDGKPVVSPYMGGYDGDIILKTVFQPDNDKRKFIEDYLGRPPSPISGLRNDVSASAQPPGLSAVSSLLRKEPYPRAAFLARTIFLAWQVQVLLVRP